MSNVKPKYLIKDNDLDEAHRLISVANEAIESLELSLRRELRNLKDALLDLSQAVALIGRRIEEDRKHKE